MDQQYQYYQNYLCRQSLITHYSYNIVNIPKTHIHKAPPMQLQKVQSAFQRKGYTPSMYIQKSQYLNILNSLMANTNTGGQFYQQVAEQLWQQASGSRPARELRIVDLCTTIVQAQAILRRRIRENQEEMVRLQGEKDKIARMTGDGVRGRLDEIQRELEMIENQNISFHNDYRLVTQPFQLDPFTPNQYRHSTNFAAYPSNSPSHPIEYNSRPQPIASESQSPQLLKMFYITLVYGLILIICIYGKYDFLNLIVLTCVLALFLLGFFDKIYIRLTMGLIVISLALDLVWLILYTSSKWSPGQKSTSSIYQLGFNRFIILATIAILPIKVLFLILLFPYRSVQATERYVVNLGWMRLVLNAGLANPISKGLVGMYGLSP